MRRGSLIAGSRRLEAIAARIGAAEQFFNLSRVADAAVEPIHDEDEHEAEQEPENSAKHAVANGVRRRRARRGLRGLGQLCVPRLKRCQDLELLASVAKFSSAGSLSIRGARA